MDEKTTKRATRVTDAKLAALRLPAGKSETRVLVAPGLYLHLRQRAGGEISKHWQYRAQVAGARRWLRLGLYPAVSLEKAGEELRKLQIAHEAAKKGEADHPVIAARFARKGALEQPTVSEAFDLWIADKRLGSKRKGGKPVRNRTVQVLTENFDLDVRGRIGDAQIGRLTKTALQTCIDAPRGRGAPGAAAQVYRLLRGLVRFAIARDWISGADPMRGIDNPRPYQPAKEVNAATDAQLVALLETVDESKRLSLSTRLAIELQLLTGCRPGEVRSARWSDLRLDRAEWIIVADRNKSDRTYTVHLSDQALAVIERAEVMHTKENELGLLFPGRGNKEMDKTTVAQALRRLRELVEAKGGKKLRPHDLRRTTRTMMSRLGVAPHVAELTLNHQETDVLKRVYDGHSYAAETTAAWDAAGAHIEALRNGGAQVIPIKKRRA
jgi:integrase